MTPYLAVKVEFYWVVYDTSVTPPRMVVPSSPLARMKRRAAKRLARAMNAHALEKS